MVGAYLQKGAIDRQVAREDEFKTNLSSLLGPNATAQQTAALQMFPNIMGQGLVSNMVAPRKTTSVVPQTIGNQTGLATQTTTTALGSEPVTNLSLIHISEPTRRTPISYAVFCLKKKK